MAVAALMGVGTAVKGEEVPNLDLNFDGTASSATGDTHWDSVVLLLDGSSLSDDLSTAQNDVSVYINSNAAKIGTVQVGSSLSPPYSNGSVSYLDFNHGDGLQVPSGFDLSYGDWTFECWARFETGTTGTFDSIFSTAVGGGVQLYYSTSPATPTLILDVPGTSGATLTHTDQITLGDWHHVALCFDYSASTMTMYIDGAGVSNTDTDWTTITNTYFNASQNDLVFGVNRSNGYPLDGQLTDIRFTKGVSRYTADFEPPKAKLPKAIDATTVDRLATSIVTQNKTGTVQSKYMGPDGKLINGYVENKSPNRDPDAPTLAGSTTPTKTTGQPAPDGSNGAVLFTAGASGNFYGVDTNVTFTQGEHYTLSCYIKVVTGTVSVGPLLTLQAFGGSTATYERAQYTISAGGGAPTLDTSRRSGSGDYSIQDVGDGWYRIWVSGQADFTARFSSPLTSSQNQVFRVDDADVGDEVLVWGLQFEEGVRVPSQFIDATDDQVTRIEYDASGNALGLLVEEARTNYYPGTTPSNTTAITFTTNQGTAPDGTNTAIKATEDSANGEKNANTAQFSVTSGTQYTMSLFAKAAGRTGIRLLMPQADFGNNLVAHYDLQGNGSILEYSGTSAPDATTITPVGNGWYRISITGTATSTATTFLQLVIDNDGTDTNTTYQGDGSSGLLIWGIQAEAGAGPTSYIPTSGASATRPADDISVATSAFGYDNSTGTTVVDAAVASETAADNFPRLFEYQGATNSDRIFVRSAEAITTLDFGYRNGGTQTITAAVTSLTWPYSYKVGIAHTGTTANHAVDGVLGTPVTIAAMTNAHTTLKLGGVVNNNNNNINGHIRRLRYWPRSINDAQLSKFTNQ